MGPASKFCADFACTLRCPLCPLRLRSLSLRRPGTYAGVSPEFTAQAVPLA
ncbi:hypothetical protein JL2886_03846 [Phaeobacter gallaeciensis]|uniref:Uncharacterized protein n=1 Tax=Phaeobacter gallaeciensis TaxID=60890 RepID=A0A1B0ZX27_9RHOB|nr:hypothetical protein JL2886_03846 [Phaeobacter gallaeciensis]